MAKLETNRAWDVQSASSFLSHLIDSTSSVTVLGDGYVVAGLHTVSIVKDSSRSAKVSAKEVGRGSGEAVNQLVASHGNVVARGSTEAVDDE